MSLLKDKGASKGIIIALVLIITLLHYSTHSVRLPLHDFYRRLYYLPIILAAFKYRLKGGFLASLSVVVLYAPHMLFYFGVINLEVINQFLEAGMFMVVGLITGFLVEGDYKKRAMLEDKISQLADLENYTHNVLNSIDSAVVSLNNVNSITTINNSALELFHGRSNILDFMRQIHLFKPLQEILGGKIPHYSSECTYTASGKPINLFIAAYPLKNIEGIIEGVVLVLQDVTKVKQLQEQLQRSERLSAIGQMASGIAHEIRNPLGIIKTISQTINKDIKDEELKEGLGIIEDEINRANKVIKELLDFAKPYRFNMEKIPVDSFLKELWSIANRMKEMKGIKVKLTTEEKVYIVGDLDKLKQAFINIILNGMQAMTNGGTLEIASRSIDDSWIVIDIKDEGRGISEEMLNKIFDPFFTTKETGAGLGLSITYRIIEEHGGKIQIKSIENSGTVVSVYLKQIAVL